MKKNFVPIRGGCLGCPLQGKTVVFPSGKMKECKLVVVGQAPGPNEIEVGKPFVGRSGKKLWDELKALGIKRKDCYVTNTVKCRPGRTPDGMGDKPPDSTTMRHCAKQFGKEWSRLHGKNVLLLGNVASKRLTKRAMSAIRGRVLDDLGDDNAYLSVWHPSFIVRGYSENFSLIWRRELSLLNSMLNKPKVRPTIPFTVIKDLRTMKKWLYEFVDADLPVSIDIETVGKQPSGPQAEILSLAISDGVKTCVIDTQELGDSADLFLKSFLESPVPKIAQNAKFEHVWFRYKYGAIMKNIWFDPGMARYLMDKGTGTSVSLKQMVWRYFPEFGGYESGIDYENMAATPKDKLYEYNALDAYLTAKLSYLLKPQLEEAGFDFVYREVLLPAIPAVGEMEAVGLKLDTEKIARKIEELQKTVKKTEKKLLKREAVKKVEDFKITSTVKLRQLFFKVLKKEIISKTRTGQESLTQHELTTWGATGNEEAILILAYRQAYKLLRTYFTNYLEMSTHEGFLHPSYNMVVAKGGRLTSSTPNIQNVPNEVREVFVSRFRQGVLLQMDFKQIEMRVMAIEANDEGLIEIFRRGGDPHRMIAAEILGVSPENVTDEERRSAKAVNFGLLYGMLPKTLAGREKMPLRRAERFYSGFFKRYAGVKRWQERQKARVLRGEEIKSLFGRVRDLSTYPPEEKVNRAYNFPIQCLPPKTKVLMTDLRWIPIEDIKVGDKLVGFDEEGGALNMKFREWREAKVTATSIKKLPVLRITFDNGETLEATAEHKWLRYYGRKLCGRMEWRRTDKLKPGMLLPKPFDVWEENTSKEAGYLAGLFDADGCLAHHNSKRRHTTTVQFCQKKGLVWNSVRRSMKSLAFDFAFNESRVEGRDYTWMTGRVRGGSLETFRFLGTIRPPRLLSKLNISQVGRFVNYGYKHRRVLSVEKVGVKEVVALATNCHTFFAEGYMSHNSCASDINLYFISTVWQIMREEEMKSVLVATVHDSLLIDCHPDEVNTVKKILKVVLESLPEDFKWMTVPMEIDVATGPNWKEAK